jgi:hypothetical protein
LAFFPNIQMGAKGAFYSSFFTHYLCFVNAQKSGEEEALTRGCGLKCQQKVRKGGGGKGEEAEEDE